jgi:ParB family chromosome partitioning protein
LPTPEAQVAALKTVVARGFSVRQTEELVRRLKAEPREAKPKESLPPEFQSLEEDFRSRLGTKVQLFRNRKGRGRLVIHFYNQEDLEALYDIIVEGR